MSCQALVWGWLPDEPTLEVSQEDTPPNDAGLSQVSAQAPSPNVASDEREGKLQLHPWQKQRML